MTKIVWVDGVYKWLKCLISYGYERRNVKLSFVPKILFLRYFYFGKQEKIFFTNSKHNYGYFNFIEVTKITLAKVERRFMQFFCLLYEITQSKIV